MKIIFNYILLVYFSVGSCIPNCDFSQISQLGNLLEHYELHQEESLKSGSVLSFTEFLYIHFVESNEHQHKNENENEHEKLPLRSISNSTALFLDFPVDKTIKSYIIILQEEEFIFKNSCYIFNYLNKIFRPPFMLY